MIPGKYQRRHHRVDVLLRIDNHSQQVGFDFIGSVQHSPLWLYDDEVPKTLTVLLDYTQRRYIHIAIPNIVAGPAGEKHPFM